MSLILKAIASFNGRDIERSRANNAREIVKLVLTETCRRVLELQNGRAHTASRKVSPGLRRIIKEPPLHAGETRVERKVSITEIFH